MSSEAWKFFIKMGEEAICALCGQTMKLPSSSTSTLLRHMRRKHRQQFCKSSGDEFSSTETHREQETERRSTMTRAQVTDKILEQKVLRQLQWKDVAAKLGMSPTWTVATCLGQGTCTPEQAAHLTEIFGLSETEALFLQQVPTRKGPERVPNDPLLYRLHEALGVYGPAMKELIHEEFGDGIMSAIDFTCHIEKEPNPAGDRVKMIWSGKFLPYKPF